MAKNPASITHKASSDDESVFPSSGSSSFGVPEPQKETEKVVVPEDGEVHLQNSHVIPGSVAITDEYTDKEFLATEGQSLEKGQYFLLPEDGVLFFHPSDSGARVQVDYLWKEKDPSAPDEEPDEDDDADDEEDEDVTDEDGTDSSSKKPKITTTPTNSLWHLDEGWFKWKPESQRVVVNDSLQAKLGTKIDFRKGISVKNEHTGKELHVLLRGTPTKIVRTVSGKKLEIDLRRSVDPTSIYVENAETGDRFTPVDDPSQLSSGAYYLESDVGVLQFSAEDAGTKVKIEFSGAISPGEVAYNYVKGTLTWGDPSAAGNSYTVEYHIKGQKGKPLTLSGEEGEEKEYKLVESFKSRAENLWTHILDNPDPAFVRETLLPIIEDEIESARDKILSMSSEPEKEKALKNFPDLTGEFIEFEQLLAKREENDDDDTRELAQDYVQTEIAPKLARFYSLASLLAERIYDMQSESEKDEDFPEFGGAGTRSLDLDALRYLKKVRQEATHLDQDLVDFSKYYTGLLISWILDPDTYYPTATPAKRKKKDSRWEGVKKVFEGAGIGLADLQAVALEAFRRAILEFDRDKRDKESIPDPKKFRIYGNPAVKRRVTNALKNVFDKYQQEQTVETTTRSGSLSIAIPPDGGEADLNVPGLRLEDLEITGPDGNTFTPAGGKLFKTEGEKRKSPRVKILLGKGMHKDSQISVTDPETGKKLSIIRSKDHPWRSELKKKVAEDPNVFYFAHSSGTIWLSDAYRGKSLIVEAPGIDDGSTGVGKDQYRIHPTKGTIEFSPLNGGENVHISYTQTIRSRRQINPVVHTDDEESVSLLDVQEDERANPADQAEEALAQENVDKLLDLIGEILLVEEDPRLNDESRAILQGLLGIGEPGGQRLTIQEIAAREPFNVDLSDSNKVNQIKAKRKKAANTLLNILREKAEDEPSLRKMVRPLEAILVGKDKSKVDSDKFLSYLKQAQEDQEDKVRPFQQVLVGLLGKAGLKQDEENILRWMWALPGKLRRDQDAEDKKYERLPDSLLPADSIGERIQEIATDEFNIEASNDGSIPQSATGIVNRVYERALDKFSGVFNTVYDSRKSFFEEKLPEFVQYYDRQLGKQTLRDELSTIENDEYRVPPAAVTAPEEKKVPLFDQIKTSLSGVDEEMLRSLMEELLSAREKGGSIHTLMRQREKDIDKLTQKGADLLDSRTKDLRAEIDELKKSVGQTKSSVESADLDIKDAIDEGKELTNKAISEDDEASTKKRHVAAIKLLLSLIAEEDWGELTTRFHSSEIQKIKDPWERKLYERYSFLSNADDGDLPKAREGLSQELNEQKEELKALRKKAVGLADEKIRKGIRKLKVRLKELKAKQEDSATLLAKQESALDTKRDELKKKLEPIQKKVEDHLKSHNSTQELGVLQRVQNFLSDREDLQRSDGGYNLDNMFEVSKPTKSKGYQPPKLQPDEEDTYQPLPSEVPQPAISEPKTLMDSVDESAPPPAKPRKNTESGPGDGGKQPSDKGDKFSPPSKKPPQEVQRTLFEELRSVALPIDPEESKKDYQKRLDNFRELMLAMRKHFSDGESIKTFKPRFSSAKTLPDQNKVLRAVVGYLRDFAPDLKKAPGIWDLTGLFKPTVTKSVDSFLPKVDLSDSEPTVEALLNAQPTLINKTQAKALHAMIQIINNGDSITKVIKGLRRTGDPRIQSAIKLAQRLAYFMSLHEDMKNGGTWNFKPLYTGQYKFPSWEEYERSKPLEHHLSPLINEIQRQLQEEAGPDAGVESPSGTEQRVLDLLHQMSELALHGMDLEQMQEHFEKEDKRGSKPYSLAYLFQQTRRFLSKLNRTVGLENMRNDMGLAEVFGPGAPAGTPTEQDEVDPVSPQEQEQLLPQDDRTTAFRQMVHVMEMDETEARVAQQLVSALQLRMEQGNKVAAELLEALLRKTPKFLPTVKKVLAFIGKNREKFESGVPGVPDLSILTGLPFKHPSIDPSGPEPENSAGDAPDVQSLLEEKVTPASEAQRKKLRKSIFDDLVTEYELDEQQGNLFADAVRALKSHAGKNGIEKLVGKTDGTRLEGVFELLVHFFKDKGLVDSDGIPDFRGVSVPALKGRDSFFKEDGTPNLPLVEEETPDFDAEDISDEMPEPNPNLEEHADELTEELGGDGARFAPDLQEAVDFLKSDQVITEEDVPQNKAKARLQKNIWNILVEEFDLDEEDQQNAAEILRAVQTHGAEKIRAQVSGDRQLRVLLDDLIDLIKEKGLDEDDIAGIQLPAAPAEEPDDVGMTIEELMGEEEPSTPSRLTPTTRREVDEDTLRTTLEVAQKAQGKGTDERLFDSIEVVRSLEGKVTPEDAKNALLQAAEQGLVDLKPGDTPLSHDDAKFVPVSPDGVPFLSGHILRMPEPAEAPQPAEPSQAKPPTRGRLPAELTNRPTGSAVYSFIVKHAGLTQDEILTLNEAIPGLENMTYRQARSAYKSKREQLSEAAQNTAEKYLRALTAYLRLVQKGRDPVGGAPTPAPTEKRPKGQWRNDSPTEKQLGKVQELAQELQALGHDLPPVSLSPTTKGEASDGINALKAALEEAKKAKSPPPAQAPKPTPQKKAPSPVGQKPSPGPSTNDRKKLQALLGKALEWSTAHDVTSAYAFRLFLQKRRPDLIPLYERIIPEVQKALDAIHGNELDFDLSDI